MEKNRTKNRALVILFFMAFVLESLVLFTDQNLRTDFGTVHPFFIHWYIFFLLDIVTVLVVIVLLTSRGKLASRIGLAWPIIMVLVMLGDIVTYSSVGFSTPSQFADYLFGFSKYPQTLNYIPGLYSMIFIIYVISIMVSLYSIRKSS